METNTLENNPFGLHLLLDGYGGSFSKLNDSFLITTLLKELPEVMGMHIIYGPVIIKANSNGKKDPGGYTGFVLIAESHISIHTFPKRGFVSIDVYSCTDFNTDMAIAGFMDAFDIKEKEISIVRRGLKYPIADIY